MCQIFVKNFINFNFQQNTVTNNRLQSLVCKLESVVKITCLFLKKLDWIFYHCSLYLGKQKNSPNEKRILELRWNIFKNNFLCLIDFNNRRFLKLAKTV